MIILFPSYPFDAKRIDPGFEAEEKAARAVGFVTAHVDTALGGPLSFHGLPKLSTQAQYERLLYRGWILKPERYVVLEKELINRGYAPITSSLWYLESNQFPYWYRALEGYTPASMILPVGDMDRIVEHVGRVFGNGSVIVKDYLKSRKHEWYDACFIRPADDADEVRRVVTNFVERQGSDLEGGLVFREFVEYKRAGIHPKSNMPIIQEWRLVVWDHKIIYAAPYWSQHSAAYEPPPVWQSVPRITDAIEKLGAPFFVLDVAPRLDGTWDIVEVNDAGTAGVPEGGSLADYYTALSRCN